MKLRNLAKFRYLKFRYILLVILILIWTSFYFLMWDPNLKSFQCYRQKGKSLPDILDENPSKGKSIFFHESSCKASVDGKLMINVREACAVESAAKLNPNSDIYLLFTAPGIIKFQGWESDHFFKALLSYDNVKIRHIDFENYIMETPAEDLYKRGKLDRSVYPTQHASDVLRYVTLWRYGGTYLDLDVIVIKSLEDLPPNYAGIESDNIVAAGVLNFSPTDEGHALAFQCLKELQNTFHARRWGNNGPGVITRVAKRICDDKNFNCNSYFKAYPIETFYPIHWTNWELYFNKTAMEKVEAITKNSYVLHFWNGLSSNRTLLLHSEAPYVLLAKKYCPKVLQECTQFF